MTFPTNNSVSKNGTPVPFNPVILVDLIDLPKSITNGLISVNPNSGRITGNGTFGPSFGVGNYKLNFCADFLGAEPRSTGTFDSQGHPSTGNSTSDNPAPLPAGGWVQFKGSNDGQIFTRVGMSFISVAQACHNAETEIPFADFDLVKSAAEDAWRKKLSVVQVDATDVNDELQTVFWSGIYRSMISPQDYTGENYLWNSTEPYYDSYYCIWDSFRSIHPLLTLLDPESQTLMVRSLIDIYRHEGEFTSLSYLEMT